MWKMQCRKIARNAEQFFSPLVFSLVQPPIFLCGFAGALFFATIQPRKPDEQA